MSKSPPAPITGVVITRNEADHIEDCLETLTWCEELILVDDRSTDDTVDLARPFVDQVVKANSDELDYFGELWYEGIKQADHEWVLRLDADERITPSVESRFREIVSNNEVDVVHLPRKAYIADRWVKGGTSWPDWTPTLFRRDAFRPPSGELHDDFNFVEGAEHERLDPESYAIPHYTDESIWAHLNKQRRYAKIRANKSSFRLVDLLFKPWLVFAYRFFVMNGYKEGFVGFVLSFGFGWHECETQLTVLKRRLGSK